MTKYVKKRVKGRQASIVSLLQNSKQLNEGEIITRISGKVLPTAQDQVHGGCINISGMANREMIYRKSPIKPRGDLFLWSWRGDSIKRGIISYSR